PKTTFSGTAGTAYVLRWTISNAPCAASSSDVNVKFNIRPNPPISGGNITQCKNPSVQTLTATATVLVGQSIVWYDSSTGGQVITNPTLNFVGTKTYYAETVDNNNSCISPSRTAVTLTINSCSIEITKDGIYEDTNSDGITNIGDHVLYNFVITNTSNVPLTNITVTDINADVIGGPINLSAGSSDSTTFTATHSITQNDIDTGYVYNWATVKGTPPTGDDVKDTSTDPTPCTSCPIDPTCPDCTITELVQSPNIVIVKSNNITVGPNGCATLKVGDVVTYTFTVNNPGNVSLNTVAVVDNHAGLSAVALQSGDTNNNNILEVTEIWIYTATYTVTQADINNGNITNQATVNGTAPDNTIVTDQSGNSIDNDDANVIPICTSPNITIVKTNNITVGTNGCATLKVGDVVTYTFTVTNPGNVSLNTVAVVDNHAGLSALALQSGDTNNNNILEVTETWIYTATYTVTQADINNGKITNQATVNGTAPDNTIVTDQSGNSIDNDDTNIIPICTSPDITIVKTNNITVGPNGCATLKVGDVVTYTFTVTNPGNVSLNTVAVVDNHAGLSAVALQSGDTNNNNILEVTETWIYTATYTVTQADINNGKITNQATVNGTAPDNTIVTDQSGNSIDNDDANVIPICTSADITIVKTNNITVGANGCATLKVGDIVTYTFTVTNPGNVSLNTVAVVDNHVGLSAVALQSGDTNNNNILEVTETWIYTATYTVTQADINTGKITNQATVNGTAPDNTIVTDQSGNSIDNDDANVIPICTIASIIVTKDGTYQDTNNDGITNVGDNVIYAFVVTNTGNVTLTNITLTDNNAVINGGPINSLLAGASNSTTFTAIHAITQNDIDLGYVYNLALVKATPPTGSDVTDTSSDPTPCTTCPILPECPDCTITIINQNPNLTVIKTTSTENYSSVGDIINYTIQVINSGNLTLHQITVTDPLTGLNTVIDVMLPGESKEFVQNYTVIQSDRENGSVINSAFANGFTPNDTPISASDDVTVEAAIVLGCGTVLVHNAFSPNGDGINEVFIIDNIDDILCYPDNSVQIYNRWGILVYETLNYNNNSNAFNGTSYGRTTIKQSSGLPTGTYYYILNYTSVGGTGELQTNRKEGYLYLNK
ncbi:MULTISPECIES: DUF7507 domain-containing protein, partial [unclassified Flavobacterium]|uniref:DUF7507 domain-containing protein n=1 Tax=unclassified Flavobacterium TaxID=196869 RepID=UPI003F8EB068